MLLKDIFNIFRVDIETIGQDDHIFLASFQIEVAMSIPGAEVAAIIPSLFECRSGLLRVLPVALGYIGTMHQDFLIRGDTYLYSWQRFADRVKDMFLIRSGGDNR